MSPPQITMKYLEERAAKALQEVVARGRPRPPEEMTVAEACEVLSRERHRMVRWKPKVSHGLFPGVFVEAIGYDRRFCCVPWMTEFEAIAIAEKYLRDKPTTPEIPAETL